MTRTTLLLDVEGGQLPADLHLPGEGRGPAVLLVQEIFGVTDYVTGRARDLAELGYVVLVPHFYWRLGDEVVEEGGAGLGRAMELMGRFDWDAGVADGAAALAALRDREEVTGPVGVLGWCFGGGLAFAIAATTRREGRGPDALVSYYGSALPSLLELAPAVTCPSLHHFGLEDAYIPVPVQEQVEAAVSEGHDDVTWLAYPGAGHAFDNPSPEFHDPVASAQAWAATTQWLRERVPV